MARAILRSSINGPTPNSMQAQLGKILTAAGFHKIGTAAYEGNFPTPQDAFAALLEGLEFLGDLPPGYEIDHLWTYLDRT